MEREYHQAMRGDDVEAWLKRRRDEYSQLTTGWRAMDDLLDDYRMHADTGTPLHAEVNEQLYWEYVTTTIRITMEIKLSETQVLALKVLAAAPDTYPLLEGVLYPYCGVSQATMRVLVTQGYAELFPPGAPDPGIIITKAGRELLLKLAASDLRDAGGPLQQQPHLLYSQASDETDLAKAAELRRRAAWADACIERVNLREQAWTQHKVNLEAEERRYQARLHEIDRVHRLRTGEEA